MAWDRWRVVGDVGNVAWGRWFGAIDRLASIVKQRFLMTADFGMS